MIGEEATAPHHSNPPGLPDDPGVSTAGRRLSAAERVLASRLRPLVAQDYDTAGDAFFGDADEAARLGATTAADALLRRARACWWIARQLQPERTNPLPLTMNNATPTAALSEDAETLLGRLASPNFGARTGELEDVSLPSGWTVNRAAAAYAELQASGHVTDVA